MSSLELLELMWLGWLLLLIAAINRSTPK